MTVDVNHIQHIQTIPLVVCIGCHQIGSGQFIQSKNMTIDFYHIQYIDFPISINITINHNFVGSFLLVVYIYFDFVSGRCQSLILFAIRSDLSPGIISR